jgi:ABC-type phosphate transport system substrate-binding protein
VLHIGKLTCVFAMSIVEMNLQYDFKTHSCSWNLTYRVQGGVVDAVARSTYSIGYSGLDAIHERGALNRSQLLCGVKIARIINRAGVAVIPSIASAQAAVRSSSFNILFNSSCAGFGLCGDVVDGADQDVWPLTAVTVMQQHIIIFMPEDAS